MPAEDAPGLEELYRTASAQFREDWWKRLDEIHEELIGEGVPEEISEELTRTAAIQIIDVMTEERMSR
jgi:hypothetical protein